MASDFVAFLRAISNVPMQPFRDALVDAGLRDVRSFGGTGNLLFSDSGLDRSTLERRVAEAVGAEAFVRTRCEVAGIVHDNPFAGRPGASIFLARDIIDPDSAGRLLAGEFGGEAPVICGAQVYFVHPLHRPRHRGMIDLERELGIRGTIRASRVVGRILGLMEASWQTAR